ncbi:MAG: hypothetical protein HC835_11365 [Oscillatoriales cyanobacterium RM2_1_1]|nr:hypothetical protein [Oscillatoriales cyanobacterium SM2_3_0]NJO46174.1 hypothetical protein [Oscillatoriales cyanobacterium RM2_1_1]
MRKWIVFRAEKRQPGWEDRKYAHTGSLTKNLFEHYDCSDRELPEPGYRPPEFIRVEALHDPSQHGQSTHYRKGDWEVTRVETYTPDLPLGEFDMIVICFCEYNPINAPLKPMPPRQVSLDSFGGDEAAYKAWKESQKEPVGVNQE